MKGAIAAFVKTPGVSPVKTRLAKSIGTKAAEKFFIRSSEKTCEIMLESAMELSRNLHVYWAVGEQDGLDSSFWRMLPTIYTGEGDLGDRMHKIYSQLLKNHDYAILIGADTPDLSSNNILEAVEIIKSGKFVFGPSHDGGFYLFGGQKPIKKEIWKSVEYSKSDTLLKLSGKFSAINSIQYLETLVDVDTAEDLKLIKTPIV